VKINRFGGVVEALAALLFVAGQLPLAKRVLRKDQTIRIHCHQKAKEWIILYKGALGISLGPETDGYEFEANGQVVIIEIPPGVAYFGLAFDDCHFLIMKSQRDRTVPCRYLGSAEERAKQRRTRAAEKRRAAKSQK
jgi:hypothetical protein